jgi:ankyrin repeat protein
MRLHSRFRIVLIAGMVLLLLPGAARAEAPPLVEAAKRGGGAALQALVAKGADVRAAAEDGTTALHWATYWDDLDSVKLLLKSGADPSAATDLGVTPLWLASLNGSAPMVEWLLRSGADATAKLQLGETAVMAAARSGSPEIVRQLAERGADLNASAARGQTALMWAVANQHVQVVEMLLELGANVHARSAVWNQVVGVNPASVPEYQRSIPHGGYTALMFAARAGALPEARQLVRGGANVNDTDAWGVSATALAAFSGFTELVGFLLDQGADPNAGTAGFTALHCAIMRRDERMVKALLSRGADPNARLQTWTPTRRSSEDVNFEPALVGASPLWLAARSSSPSVLRLLVDSGADPLFVLRNSYFLGRDDAASVPQQGATTVLMAALGMGGGGGAWVAVNPAEREALVLESVRLIVELGVDVNAADTNGGTALQAAEARDYSSVVEYLMAKGAKS